MLKRYFCYFYSDTAEFIAATLLSYPEYAELVSIARAMKNPQFDELDVARDRFKAESNPALFDRYMRIHMRIVENSEHGELVVAVARFRATLSSNPELAKVHELAIASCRLKPGFLELLFDKICAKLKSTPEFKKKNRARAAARFKSNLEHIQRVVIQLPTARFIYISEILTKFCRKIRSSITF